MDVLWPTEERLEGESNGFSSNTLNFRGWFSLALVPFEKPSRDMYSAKRGLSWGWQFEHHYWVVIGKTEQGRGLV